MRSNRNEAAIIRELKAGRDNVRPDAAPAASRFSFTVGAALRWAIFAAVAAFIIADPMTVPRFLVGLILSTFGA